MYSNAEMNGNGNNSGAIGHVVMYHQVYFTFLRTFMAQAIRDVVNLWSRERIKSGLY